MFSMTGYGKGEYRSGNLEIVVEAKSVNNRYLDLSLKCPRLFTPYEELIRSIVREHVARGHVEVFVSYTDRREKTRNASVDLNALRAYESAAKEIKEALPEVKDDLTLSFFLRLPDVVRFEEAESADDELVEGLKEATVGAMLALKSMRLAEGERLKKDVVSRVQTISALRDKIALRAPLVAEEYRKKLTLRMQELLSGKADEARILTEAAVYTDKCNIDEELTRLSSHVAEFYNIAQNDTVGRKLDFLVQEFNRECNTICSKSNDAEVTAHALEMKNEIEKIREQIQNLE